MKKAKKAKKAAKKRKKKPESDGAAVPVDSPHPEPEDRTGIPWKFPPIPSAGPAPISTWMEYATGQKRLEWVIRIPIARPALLATWFCLLIHRYFWPLPKEWRRPIEEVNFKAKFSLKPVGLMALAMMGVAMIVPLMLGRRARRKSA